MANPHLGPEPPWQATPVLAGLLSLERPFPRLGKWSQHSHTSLFSTLGRASFFCTTPPIGKYIAICKESISETWQLMLFKFAVHFKNVLTSRKLFECSPLHLSSPDHSKRVRLHAVPLFILCMLLLTKRCFISQWNGANKIRAKCLFHLSIETNAFQWHWSSCKSTSCK